MNTARFDKQARNLGGRMSATVGTFETNDAEEESAREFTDYTFPADGSDNLWKFVERVEEAGSPVEIIVRVSEEGRPTRKRAAAVLRGF